MISDTLKTALEEALARLGIGAAGDISLEHPEELVHGDYSTNIAMVSAKKLGRNPRDLAQAIVLEILKKKPKEVLRIEVAGPGFVNFHLTREFFADEAKKIVKAGEKFGRTDTLEKKKFLVEHTQPNPFKEFHIGHLMNNAIGESLSRIIRNSGAEVRDVSYHGDVGLHVAKAIWWLLAEKTNTADFATSPEAVKHLAKAYAAGDRAYNDDEDAKKRIEAINKKIYDRSDAEINALYDWGKKASLAYFESVYEELGSRFEKHFYESETGPIGKKLVEENLGAVFEKSEGAVVFRGEKFGLHTRVFVNKDGLPTYEAKELGLAELKRKFYAYDTSLTITANEQDSFFKVVEAAIGEVFPKLKGKLAHIGHGLLKLPTGKMSSRTGSVISAEALIVQVKEKVYEKIAGRDLSNIEREDIAEAVALGAIKYSVVRQSAGRDIIFDFDASLSFEGDSGPYLQYSHARARSILRKALLEGVKADFKRPTPEADELEKTLYRFPEVAARACLEYSPHYIATYLTELASAFNAFYGRETIVEKNDAASPYKVALTQAFSIVLANGLRLLGIEAPEKM